MEGLLSTGPTPSSFLGQASRKQTIESVILIIPCLTIPPSFLRAVIVLDYFFYFIFYIN